MGEPRKLPKEGVLAPPPPVTDDGKWRALTEDEQMAAWAAYLTGDVPGVRASIFSPGTVRDALPEAARSFTQLVADNPGQMAVLLSGAYLAGKVAAQVVRPRGPLEALALFIVLNAAVGYAGTKLIRSGVVRIRVRDENGCLVPLGGDRGADSADPAG